MRPRLGRLPFSTLVAPPAKAKYAQIHTFVARCILWRLDLLFSVSPPWVPRVEDRFCCSCASQRLIFNVASSWQAFSQSRAAGTLGTVLFSDVGAKSG